MEVAGRKLGGPEASLGRNKPPKVSSGGDVTEYIWISTKMKETFKAIHTHSQNNGALRAYGLTLLLRLFTMFLNCRELLHTAGNCFRRCRLLSSYC